MAKQLYLLTGAAGFLGSHISSQLLNRGDDVRAFMLTGDPAIKYIPDDAEIIEGDLCNLDDCEKLFTVPKGRQTVCIHCASMVTVNPIFNRKLYEVNVHGTKNMLDVAKKHPECKKFVYISSTGAIPESEKGHKIKEVTEYFPYDETRVVG